MRIAKISAEIVETKVLKFGAQTFGLFVLCVHNRIFKQSVQSLSPQRRTAPPLHTNEGRP